MEKIKNRGEFIEKFNQFCDVVDLNEDFMKRLKEHEYFRNHIKNINEYKYDETKKVYILLELTNKRKSCEAIVELLENSGQREAAKQLKKFNTSPGLLKISELSTKTEIPVGKTKIPIVGSLNYIMSKKPRGRCIVINNEWLLYKETQRFKHVFRELYFDVKPSYNLNVKKIKEKLEKLSKDKSLAQDDALVIMIIGHGQDEKILGFDYEDKNDENDSMKISEIVDIFSEQKCKQLERKPKIFIFDCCRIKVDEPLVRITPLSTENSIQQTLRDGMTIELEARETEKYWLKFSFADTKWVQKNANTFLIYSSSEGYESHSSNTCFMEDGITAFGQAFSHAIARYACEESLQQIMSRTCTLMEQFQEIGKYSAPELRKQCVGRDLYFNVGTYD